MTDLKISQLPVQDTLTGEEIIPIVSEGDNKAVSASKIKSFAVDEIYDELKSDINTEADERSKDMQYVVSTMNTIEPNIRDYYDPIVDQNTTDITTLQTTVSTLESSTNSLVNGLQSELNSYKSYNDGRVDTAYNYLYSMIEAQHVMKGQYDAIFSLCKEKKLVVGGYYGITDYTCAYNHPSMGTDEEFEMNQPANDVECIILRAISEDKFDEEVFYIRKPGYVPIRKCLYTIDPEELLFTKGMTTYHPTGCVYYMEDMNKNSACYDFKHVKFRRWAIKDITANMTPNDGTGGKFGPYRVMISRTTSYNMSDGRQIIGSGEENEVNLIPAIFNGTYRGNPLIPDMASKTAFHEDYIRDNLKPYQNTTKNQNDKYLAWQTDMYAKKGISVATNTGYANKMGQCNVTVDSEDYMDRYTFDYNGTDASERMRYNSTTDYLIYNTRIKSNDQLIL